MDISICMSNDMAQSKIIIMNICACTLQNLKLNLNFKAYSLDIGPKLLNIILFQNNRSVTKVVLLLSPSFLMSCNTF